MFTIPPTDLSAVKYKYVKVSPQTSSLTPIEIYVERQSECIDLSRSFIEIDAGFKTDADANWTSRADDTKEMLCPINNLAHSLFKQINVKCNGTLLMENVGMYHHEAYIQTLLNYDRVDGDTILRSQG